MDIYTLTYLLRYSLFKPGAMRAYREILANEQLTLDELKNLNWRKTSQLLHHAYHNVPYYQSKFNTIGLHPNDITAPEYFSQVPILTRDDVIANFDALFAKGACRTRSKTVTTGGSTGTPVKIGQQRNVIREAPKWQMLSWWGLSPATDMATLYRETPLTTLERLALAFVSWPRKVIRGDATNLSPSEMNAFITAFQKHQPKLLHGYAGALDAVASAILEKGISVPPPRVVWSTAAPLSKVQEETITRAFGAPVCDQYGCSEVYFIAAECPEKDGLHIFSDSKRVEFVDDESCPVSDGQYGRIVVTNLEDYCFPLIRYVNGDTGRALPGICSCGRSLPRMDKVSGRTSDRIVLPDGTILAGEYLTTIFDDWTAAVARFQVVQKRTGAIEVLVVFRDSATKREQVLKEARMALTSRIGGQVTLNMKAVTEISAERGKLQYIIREQ